MMQPTHRAFFALATAVLLGAAACDSAPSGPDEGALAGGVLATFQVQDEQFKVWTADPEAIEDLQALEAGRSRANIPNGRLRRGPGRGDHNAPWSWHLDPEDVAMAEVTVEVCDGLPSFVEEERDRWIEEVGRYCPWSAELVELRDFR